MKFLLLCCLAAFATAAPSGGPYAPAVPAPHAVYGLPDVGVPGENLVNIPDVSTSVPSVSPIVEHDSSEIAPIVNEDESVVPVSSPLPPSSGLPSLSIVPGRLPFVTFLQQQPLVIQRPLGFIGNGQPCDYQNFINPFLISGIRQIPGLSGSISVPVPVSIIAEEEERPISEEHIVENNDESVDVNEVGLSNEYGLPAVGTPLVIPPAPPLPQLAELPEVPVIGQIPSTSAPIVPSPQNVYGVPEIQALNTGSSGPYPASSQVITHYGQPI